MMMLRAAGMFLVALGFIWVLQGAGLLDWPASSSMLGQDEWITRGAALMGAGALLAWLPRLRRRG